MDHINRVRAIIKTPVKDGFEYLFVKKQEPSLIMLPGVETRGDRLANELITTLFDFLGEATSSLRLMAPCYTLPAFSAVVDPKTDFITKATPKSKNVFRLQYHFFCFNALIPHSNAVDLFKLREAGDRELIAIAKDKILETVERESANLGEATLLAFKHFGDLV